MTTAIQVIVDALSVGSLYALTALGIGLIFGIMRLINFAHGEFVMIGAYMLMAIVAQYEPLAIIVSMVLVVILSLWGLQRKVDIWRRTPYIPRC